MRDHDLDDDLRRESELDEETMPTTFTDSEGNKFMSLRQGKDLKRELAQLGTILVKPVEEPKQRKQGYHIYVVSDLTGVEILERAEDYTDAQAEAVAAAIEATLDYINDPEPGRWLDEDHSGKHNRKLLKAINDAREEVQS